LNRESDISGNNVEDTTYGTQLAKDEQYWVSHELRLILQN